MNRKSFIFASLSIFAATLITSCSANEDIENSLAPAAAASDAITFRVDNASNARTSTRDMETSVTGFRVSAIDRGAEYFSARVSSSDNGNSWTSSTSTYWPEGRSLTFVAYVDQNPNGSSFQLDGSRASFTDYTVPADVRDHSDLMYAVAKDATRESSANGVGLRFRHALAQVSFTAQNNHPAYESIEILSVELGGVKGKGSYSFPQESTASASRGEWTIDANAADAAYTISDLGITLPACGDDRSGEKVSLGADTRSEGDNVMFLMPQADEDAYIKVTARMTLKDVPGASYVTEEVIPVSVDWKEGQRYSYNIAWNATPITFDVTVADFREVSATAE